MPQRFQEALIIFAVVTVGLIVLVIAMIAISGANINVLGFGEEPPAVVKDENGNIVVSDERVVRDYEDALEAAPLALLPNHLPSSTQAITLPSQQRSQMQESVADFLREWESFQPYEKDYPQRVARHALPAAADSLVRRNEVIDPEEACYEAAPQEVCLVGQEWRGGSPPVSVYAYDEDKAYVTAYGVVEMKPLITQTDPPAGDVERAYALLVRQDDLTGEWLVERAVAETVSDLG